MKTFEFRLKPTKPQERRLNDYMDACRGTYNWALDDRINMYNYAKCSTNFFDQSRYLIELKKQRRSLDNIHVHVLQTTLKRLDLAFQAFFRRVKAGEKPGFPRFKGLYSFDSFSFKEYGNGFKLEKNRLTLSKIGRVRIKRHREITGEIKTCIIKHRADGWYALFTAETEPVPINPLRNPVGIDVGLNSFLATSTETIEPNPRFLKKALKELKRQQRILSKRKKNSKRRHKAREILARSHLRVARCRKTFHYKLASDLVKLYNPIFHERLDIKGLIEKAGRDKEEHKAIRARAENILDAGWGLFLQRLRSKAESAGSATKAVEPRGTSQICSRCGRVVSKGLEVRVHICPYCGLVMNRDVNSAKVVRDRGLEDESKEVAATNKDWAGPSGRGAGRKLSPMIREATPL